MGVLLDVGRIVIGAAAGLVLIAFAGVEGARLWRSPRLRHAVAAPCVFVGLLALAAAGFALAFAPSPPFLALACLVGVSFLAGAGLASSLLPASVDGEAAPSRAPRASPSEEERAVPRPSASR